MATSNKVLTNEARMLADLMTDHPELTDGQVAGICGFTPEQMVRYLTEIEQFEDYWRLQREPPPSC
jgi:hypothetical protein